MLQLMRNESTLAPMRDMFNTFADGFAGSALSTNLPLDINETPDQFQILASVPGLTKDQIDLEIDGGVLTLSTSVCCQTTENVAAGEDPCGCQVPEADGTTVLRKERSQVSASRSIRLPVDVDEDSINASLENGVLTITVAKPDAQTPRKLQID
ncbi:MAG: Hsp20/alpha crystallin family protein [Planctomycetota bacterium]|nr:Hsp20/alpha crystallin family protein [Planctomycetota bacterium]